MQTHNTENTNNSRKKDKETHLFFGASVTMGVAATESVPSVADADNDETAMSSSRLRAGSSPHTRTTEFEKPAAITEESGETSTQFSLQLDKNRS